MISFNEWMRRFLFLPEQASSVAARLDHLHYFVILTTFAGSFGVFSMTGYFVVRYRRRSEFEVTEHFVTPHWLEAIYIAGPLALFLLWFFMGFARFMELEVPPPDSMDVYVTAKQWMWKFTYPEGLSSIDVLHVPVGRPVRLLMTSRDVIHSFFVPAFRIKQDVVPGRYTETWFQAVRAGRWRVLCAEYCGLKHSQMMAEVVALPPEEYEEWLADQQVGLVARRDASGPPVDLDLPNANIVPAAGGAETGPYGSKASGFTGLSEQGRTIAAEKGCLECHSVDGSSSSGPTWLDLYLSHVPLSDGTTVIADEAYLTESMMDPAAKVVAGFKPVMPTFLGHLTAPDTAALLEYIKSLRSGLDLQKPTEEHENGSVR